MTKKINLDDLSEMTDQLLKRINSYTPDDMLKLKDDPEFKIIIGELMNQDIDTLMELLGRCAIEAGIFENPLDAMDPPKDKDNT